ncbi:Protease 4 [Listeria grayi]|uniref:Protease 4 n=1 Tax=Listeria grayi TaxID=1641 RepID=A0A378MAL0_LISGR|nr:Protease 4 [Listeria grayi]
MINDSYDEFVNVIATGRHMSKEKVRKIADGRVYDGRQAKKIGLIDQFGYKEDAIRALKKKKDCKMLMFLNISKLAESKVYFLPRLKESSARMQNCFLS